MRVSIPICIACSVLVVVLTWWLSTRSRDFMTAPPESELEKIRLATAQQNPTAQGMGDALSPSSPDDDQAPIPVILPKHVKSAPRLDDYLEEANFGAEYLVELAELLKVEHPERALTSWERVLDSTKANDNQRQRAARHITKLKKSVEPWNSDPNQGIKLMIQAGTGPTTASHLKPILDDIALMLETASSGILKVETKVSAGEEDLIDEGEAPVAVWISGPGNESKSTDIMSFTHAVDSTDGLRDKAISEIYNAVRHRLKQMDDFQPLPKQSGQNSPDKLLEGYITRMVWKYFAESLQPSS